MLLNRIIVGAILLLSQSNCAITLEAGQKGQEAFASREYFYIGGSYVNTSTGHLFMDQMYVEKLSPTAPSQPYPVVLIHGQAQTGTVSSIASFL